MTGSQDTVRAALLQTDWTGSKDTMIDKHEAAVHEAAKQGAQVMCFQDRKSTRLNSSH